MNLPALTMGDAPAPLFQEVCVQKYDLAVVGAGLAGLTAAALLSKAGKSVLLTDPAEVAGGSLRASGRDAFRFPGGHDLTYGLEAGGHLQSLYASLDIAPSGPLHEVTYQVAMPDRRITVTADTRITMEELRREFPSEIDRFVRLYRQARDLALKSSKSRLASSLVRWRSAKPLLRSQQFGPEATAYFDVQSRFFFGRPVDDLPLESLVLLLDAAPRTLPGGFGRLAAQLMSFVTERNGRVMMKEPWPELLFQGRRVSGIRTSGGTIEPCSTVLNTSWEKRERTVLFGMREEVLPVGMERNLLCLPDYARPADFFFLSLSGAGEDAPGGMRSGTATFHGSLLRDAPVASLRERVERIMPFLSDFLVFFDERDGDTRRFPLPDHLAGKRPAADAGSLPPVSSPLRNLFLIYDAPWCVPQTVRAAHRIAARLH